MNVMFMGTPDFASESLRAICDSGHNVSSVITMPDKPRGRGHNITATVVAKTAEELGIEVHKPENLKRENFEHILTQYNPDVIVVVAYGKILPEYVLNYPKYGCVNVHASLLPKFRGAAPIQRSIIDGEKITGVTTMCMNKGLDTGDMLLKSETEITPEDNFETLHDKLSASGAALIVETLSRLENGTVTPEKQNDDESTYAHMITGETMLIDWSKPAHAIHNLVRGLYPVPKAYSFLSGKRMKICKTVVSGKENKNASPGTIVETDKKSIYVSCGDSTVIRLESIQPEGKREMAVEDYLKGNQIELNSVFGG